jgi:hypothetical protein
LNLEDSRPLPGDAAGENRVELTVGILAVRTLFGSVSFNGTPHCLIVPERAVRE